MSVSLADIWRSLPPGGPDAGWQSIGVSPDSTFAVSAAIRHPEALEALILETTATAIRPHTSPPEARGFRMMIERRSPGPDGTVLLILQRTEEGSAVLFAQIAEDALRVIERCTTRAAAADAFVARMVAWKKFMHDMRDSGMSETDETGLLGELVVAGACLTALGPEAMARGWVGAEGGLHDFAFAACGIEVKTTLGGHNLANIFCIDQLDPAGLQELFLFRVHARLDAQGRTLPEWVEELLLRCQGVEELLRDKLLLAGYAEANRHQFTRRYLLVDVQAFEVNDEFPCLRRTEIPAAIHDASYRLDLRQASKFALPTERVFERIGAVIHGP